ncbi:MAG: RluA family pseudouridine synthase, partial [Myxococcales bacterium]|nr:RluA family pseudouridine synthase [Myxococcales bacterium]
MSRGGRLDVVLVELFPEHSRSRIGALVKDGHARVDEVVVTRPSHKVPPGAVVELDVPDAVPVGVVAQDLPIHIVYEDTDVAVIDKAPGLVVHPGAGHADGTLVNALLHHLDDLSGIGGELRPGIVHRLDRGTSGLIVVAKNDQAHRHLAAQFADHSAGREYLALVVGRPPALSGTIRSFLARHPRDRVRFASADDGRLAVTHWSVERTWGTVVLVRCRLETGRTHQIRVHLSEHGLPLLGDPLYGRARPPASIRDLVDPDRPLLHAEVLHFEHPDGR